MQQTQPGTIAISHGDFTQFGCPHCGYKYGSYPVTGQGAAAFECGECHKVSVILADGVTRSPYGIGTPSVCPELGEHPRKGTPAHGNKDEVPEGGGEFYKSRGIGLDSCPGCFICGGQSGMLYHNISGFVKVKEAGERIVAMFESGAWLDWRHNEPNWIQVKIGACVDHKPNLEKLNSLLSDGIITKAKITEAKAFKPE